MLSQLSKPKTINQFTPITLKNINNDPCEYLRYQFERTSYLKEKIRLHQLLIEYCREPNTKEK